LCLRFFFSSQVETWPVGVSCRSVCPTSERAQESPAAPPRAAPPAGRSWKDWRVRPRQRWPASKRSNRAVSCVSRAASMPRATLAAWRPRR
ncbi:hypothetical protein EPR50_G00244910, partial [Perca flavescens]